jgi:23S rRNA pseudouridine1911/1915/1917 synthase
MKLSSKDALNILRQYKIANTDNVPKQIVSIKTGHSDLTNNIFSFCFMNSHYYILFDENVDDDSVYAEKQIKAIDPNSKIKLLHNPYPDNESLYSIPFKGKDCYLFLVIADHVRLDNELHRRHPEISRSLCQKYIKSGLVQVNDKTVKSVDHKITINDKISIHLPEISDYSKEKLPVIYIDDDVIVVDKPIGVLSHAKGAISEEFTVADFFKKYTTYNTETNRPGIIHRLDRDTSGIIIGARNNETATLLQRQFSDRKTKKIYLAIVEGHPKLDVANIDLPISRNKSKPSTFRVDASGKSAYTKYEVIDKSDNHSLIKLQPHTGRTHQLRVHLSYINNPILGDKAYGHLAERLFLHAYSLEITIPNGERKTFTTSIPKEFNKYFPDINI